MVLAEQQSSGGGGRLRKCPLIRANSLDTRREGNGSSMGFHCMRKSPTHHLRTSFLARGGARHGDGRFLERSTWGVLVPDPARRTRARGKSRWGPTTAAVEVD